LKQRTNFEPVRALEGRASIRAGGRNCANRATWGEVKVQKNRERKEERGRGEGERERGAVARIL
jgi:hypothetical protein